MNELFDSNDKDQETKKVECLGLSFESEEARRAYFTEKLREKLKDPEFRKIDGFPLGEDEDILALSDPPYYTACPNPFLEVFVEQEGTPYDPKEPYHREPFAADVSEGKNDPIYNAHSYHTKVPHKAIMRYILHYTEPGDLIFDGFAGTGMTGVAAQLCGDKCTIEELGYTVKEDGTIYQDKSDVPFSKLGPRKAILNDLSPAATFIAYNYNTPVDTDAFAREAERILDEVETECGWMYWTLHNPSEEQLSEAVSLLKQPDFKRKIMESNLPVGTINYTVWSDVFTCPECMQEVVFWEAAVDKKEGSVNKEFPCPHCKANLSKKNMQRAFVTRFDEAIGENIRQAKQLPVLINYSLAKGRAEKTPDEFDKALLEKIEESSIPYWFPTEKMMFKGEKWGDTWRAGYHAGVTHVHHFYTKRNLWVLSHLKVTCQTSFAKLIFQSISATLCSRIVRYNLGNRGNGPLTGTLYVSSLLAESNCFKVFRKKKGDLSAALQKINYSNYTHTQSLSIYDIQEKSIDYIFTDPPFGGNLMYSELNFLWEAWLKVFTNNKKEAIENSVQGKGLLEYQGLMTECFTEYYRVLKPGRWVTVEFHNSKNSVWNAIQEALQKAGFIIADVRVLDKKQGSFKQVTSVGAVKQDLIISAYKPNGGLEKRFQLEAGTLEGVWDFIRTHMGQLPVFVKKNGQAEVIGERQNFLLYDRMVAFHVQRGVMVPVSAVEFYQGLEEKFPERDGMYFLPEQAAEYDKKRMTVKELKQLEIFVVDENSAIQWLKQQLKEKPQTFADLQPKFLQEIGGWSKNEQVLDLRNDLLEQNFLLYDGNGPVPNQIHSYLSTNFKDLRGLDKYDPKLKEKAKGRWYIPDPSKAADLEKMREKALLKEFQNYVDTDKKKFKQVRLEAVRAGFKKAWQERDYRLIIAIADKIDDKILQEDEKLLMWYDQALTRVSNEDVW
jgi:DNA modification methylase